MSLKTKNGRLARLAGFFAACGLVMLSLPLSAAWQVVATEQGKQIEIERTSVTASGQNGATALGRVVLDKPIVDPRTSAAYQTIEILNRYDCKERTYATLKRIYYKENGELLRQEEVKLPYDMPVRSGTPDGRLLREVCRPNAGTATAQPSGKGLDKMLEKVNDLAGDLRKTNDNLIDQAVKKDMQRITKQSERILDGATTTVVAKATTANPAAVPVSAPRKRSVNPVRAAPEVPAPAVPAGSASWSYEGIDGPGNWGRLTPAYAACKDGVRQSPIDLRDTFAVDLEPIRFVYQPAAFRVSATRRHLQLTVHGGGLMLLGKEYRLENIRFHTPAEFTLAGKSMNLEVQLLHRADDGKLAVVSILFEQGEENPVIQAALNNLPLEKGGEVAPSGQTIDLNRLLPDDRGYFTFMGSLTTPPCTEDVIWLVLKKPRSASADQLAILQRLYSPNARPVQPAHGRIIKESR